MGLGCYFLSCAVVMWFLPTKGRRLASLFFVAAAVVVFTASGGGV